MKALLLQGQDPNQTDYSGQYTPLIAAAFLAHIQVHVVEFGGGLCCAVGTFSDECCGFVGLPGVLSRFVSGPRTWCVRVLFNGCHSMTQGKSGVKHNSPGRLPRLAT